MQETGSLQYSATGNRDVVELSLPVPHLSNLNARRPRCRAEMLIACQEPPWLFK